MFNDEILENIKFKIKEFDPTSEDIGLFHATWVQRLSNANIRLDHLLKVVKDKQIIQQKYFDNLKPPSKYSTEVLKVQARILQTNLAVLEELIHAYDKTLPILDGVYETVIRNAKCQKNKQKNSQCKQ